MMEQWNNGFWENGEVGVGRIPLDRELNKVNVGITSLLKPTFHHSIIPLFHVRGRSSGLE